MSARTAWSILVGIFLALAAVELIGGRALAARQADFRLLRAGPAAFDLLGRERPLDVALDRAEFRRRTAELPRGEAATVASVVVVLRWVMNRASVVGPGPPATPLQALERGERGEGLLCGDMTAIFEAALGALGYRARKLQLARSVHSALDTHATVEVLVDGRWLLFDPTFNLSARHRGRWLGAAEVRALLLAGEAPAIELQRWGEVRYPARLDEQQSDWLLSFNNIFIDEAGRFDVIGAWPPLRYWHGPRRHVLEASERGLWHDEAFVRLQRLFALELPAALLFIGGLLIALPLGRRLMRRRAPD